LHTRLPAAGPLISTDKLLIDLSALTNAPVYLQSQVVTLDR